MTREEAIENVRSFIGQLTEDCQASIRSLVPELQESEDEQVIRIIKKRMCYDPVPISDEDRRIVENWLEKHKEPIPIPDKFSGLKSLLLQYLQSAANRTDDTEIESDTDLWGRKILDYVWKYSEKQKEQKPADDEAKAIAYREYERGRESGLRDGQKYVLDNAESYGLCKPAEWSKEDEYYIDAITTIINRETALYPKGGVTESFNNDLITWLKDIRLNLKKKNDDVAKHGYDEAYLQEKIAKASKTWEGVDVDKYMDEVRGREQEQPEVDLEKEIDKVIADYSFTKTIDSGGFKTTVIDYAKIARHFYELGKARKEK